MDIFINDFNGLGPLYYDEILVYYDSPQLFTVIDKCKNRYLAMLINDDSILQYFVLNISKERLTDIKDSSLSIKEAFTNPEMNRLFKIEGQLVSSILSKDLSVNDLPDDNLYLNMLIDTSLLLSEQEKQWDKVRDSLNLRLINSGQPKEHEIDCGVFAKIISSIQNLITSQAKCKYRNKFNISDIIEMSKLNFSSTYIGSVGIKFKTKDRRNLIEETRLTPILESLSEMVNECTIEDIENYFNKSNYDYKVISDYKNYLNTLIKNNLDVEYKISVKNQNISHYLKNDEIREQYNNLSNYISNKTFYEDFEGILVAVDTKNRTFKLESDGKIISGSIRKDLSKYNYKVNTNVVFKLEVTQEKNRIGGNLIEKFKLIEIVSQN